MKKIILTLTLALTLALATGSTLPTAQACAGPVDTWTTSTLEAQEIYDFNRDGKTNIIDLILAKEDALMSNSLTIGDVMNLQAYIVSGDFLQDPVFFEEDMHPYPHSDEFYTEIMSGKLVQWKYDNGSLRMRYLHDNVVFELRCNEFDSSDEIFQIVEKPDGENLCGIVRYHDSLRNEDRYVVNVSYLWNNAVSSPQLNQEFDSTDILWISEGEKSTTFYVDRGDFVQAIELPVTEEPKYFEGIVSYDTRLFMLCYNDLGHRCIYRGGFTAWDLSDWTIDLKDSELVDKINMNLAGELVQYNTGSPEDSHLLIKEDDGSFMVMKMPVRYTADTEKILRTWELNGETYALGIAQDGSFVWDVHSNFGVG